MVHWLVMSPLTESTKWYLVVRLKMSHRINLSHLTVDPATWQDPSLGTEAPRLHFVAFEHIRFYQTLSYCNNGAIQLSR